MEARIKPTCCAPRVYTTTAADEAVCTTSVFSIHRQRGGALVRCIRKIALLSRELPAFVHSHSVHGGTRGYEYVHITPGPSRGGMLLYEVATR